MCTLSCAKLAFTRRENVWWGQTTPMAEHEPEEM